MQQPASPARFLLWHWWFISKSSRSLNSKVKKNKNAQIGVCMCSLFSEVCWTMPWSWILQEGPTGPCFASLLKTVSPQGSKYTEWKRKKVHVCFCFGCVWFGTGMYCISLRKPCKPRMILPYFHFHWNETQCAKAISHMPHQNLRKNYSAGPCNLQFPILLFANANKHIGVFQYSFPYSISDKTAAVVGPGEKRPRAGKSLWRSITQFSVGSAADTQVIYSEGARTS